MGPNLVLVGFMGTGKTEVGKAVSERLGKTFVDIDDQIVQDCRDDHQRDIQKAR